MLLILVRCKRIIRTGRRVLADWLTRMLSTKRHVDTGEISPNAGPFDVRM